MSLKVLHTADWHMRGKNLDEIYKCLLFIVAYALKEKPDVIVVSGDITDSRALQLESKSAQLLIQIISDMLNIAPVAIITGTPSHDGKTALALRACRGKYQILVSDMPEQYGYCKISRTWKPLDSGFFDPDIVNPSFIITQIPTPTKQYFINNLNIEDSDHAIAEAMGVLFANFGLQSESYKKVPHIANGHLSVGGAYISETQQLIGRDIEVSSGQLNALNAEVVCLGHIHKSQKIGSNIFYAGSPAKMNFGEKEDKGFYSHNIISDADMKGDFERSVFVKTPARNLIEIKEDFTKENSDINEFYDSIDKILSSDIADSSVKITITVWQDEAGIISKSELEELFLDAKCHEVKFLLIRKPRTTVRSERVLEAVTLPDKLSAMAELRGEGIDESILIKAAGLETNESTPWKLDYKKIKENRAKC